ncbi:14041_t:CDS:2, partial [Acaulospora morrowiae]
LKMPKSKNKTRPVNGSLSSYFPPVPSNERKNATAFATTLLENPEVPQEKRVIPRKKIGNFHTNTRRGEALVQKGSGEVNFKEEKPSETKLKALNSQYSTQNNVPLIKQENEDLDFKVNIQNNDSKIKQESQASKKKMNWPKRRNPLDESYEFMSDEEVWTDKTKERWLNLQRTSQNIVEDLPEETIDEMPLTEEQHRVYQLVLNSRDSLFFTGSAGSGKSMLLQRIITSLKKRLGSDSVAVTAPTGVAAINIGGNTLHWFSGIGKGDEKEDVLIRKVKRNLSAKLRWTKVEALIIDEISMLDGALFDKLESIARHVRNNSNPFGGIQVIVTGDFFQLPPIADSSNNVKFCFEANSWKNCIKHTIQLTQVFRQKETELITILNDMRVGMVTPNSLEYIKKLQCEPDYPDDGILPTELFPRNIEVNNANMAQLNKIKHKSYSFYANDWEPDRFGQLDKLDKNCLAPKVLTLKKDAQVMLIKNLNKDLVNGSRGVVIGYQSSSTEREFLDGNDEGLPLTDLEPIVKFDNGHRAVIKEAEWTLNGMGDIILARLDLTRVFEKGQAYVALSRAVSIKAIQVIGFDEKRVMVHEKVKNYYKSLSFCVKNEHGDQDSSSNDLNQPLKPKIQEENSGSLSTESSHLDVEIKNETGEAFDETEKSKYFIGESKSHDHYIDDKVEMQSSKRKIHEIDNDASYPLMKRRNMKLNWGDENKVLSG